MKAWQGPLWDAINRYAETCGGDPSKHVYGNTPRQQAVVNVNRIVEGAAAAAAGVGRDGNERAMKNRGLHQERFARNPEEKRFAQAWEKINAGIGAPDLICPLHEVVGYLLGDGARPERPLAWQVELAATVIQWLGSEVGQNFLAGLGYVKKRPAHEGRGAARRDRKEATMGSSSKRRPNRA